MRYAPPIHVLQVVITTLLAISKYTAQVLKTGTMSANVTVKLKPGRAVTSCNECQRRKQKASNLGSQAAVVVSLRHQYMHVNSTDRKYHGSAIVTGPATTVRSEKCRICVNFLRIRRMAKLWPAGMVLPA